MYHNKGWGDNTVTQIPIYSQISFVQLSLSKANPCTTFKETQPKQCFVTPEGQSCWDSFTVHVSNMQNKHVWRRTDISNILPPFGKTSVILLKKSPLGVTSSCVQDKQQCGQLTIQTQRLGVFSMP